MRQVIFCFSLLLCLVLMDSVAVAQPQFMPQQEAVDFINGKTYLFCTQEDDCVLTTNYCGFPTAMNKSLVARYEAAKHIYGTMISCELPPSTDLLSPVATCSAGQCVIKN